MEFNEIIERAKLQFPVRFDNDEVCRFFNSINISERERALEFLKNTTTSRVFPIRTRLVELMRDAGIKMAESNTEEWGYEWRCKNCNAHRPIGLRLCPKCGDNQVAVCRARNPITLSTDERQVTPEELAEFQRFLANKGYAIPAAVRYAETKTFDRRMPYRDE